MPPAPPSDSPETRALLQRALESARAGHRQDAIDGLRRLIAGVPAHVAALSLLGVLLSESGEHIAALRELDAAASLAPHDARLQETRAAVLLTLGRPADAEHATRQALASDARRPRALLQLAHALDAQQRGDEAVATLQLLLTLQPDNAVARRLLARNLLLRNEPALALAAALHPSVLQNPAVATDVAGDFYNAAPRATALALLQALCERHADNYTFVILYARLLHQCVRSSAALTWSERAHALDPQAAEPIEMRAVSLIDRGEVSEGLALYGDLLARPDAAADADMAGRHLILAHYDPAQDNAALFAAHRDWALRHARPSGTSLCVDTARDPQRRLRIGWLSPRFGGGPVASFLSGLLRAFDRTAFEHCLVSLRASDDVANARRHALADQWLDLHGLDDQALLQRLRKERFDIVIDLAGHAVGNRLRVLAQRVAPIQLCWLDYFDTTGIDAMDGWISDAWLTPENSPQRYSERLLRLGSGRFCYTPPDDAPAPTRIDGAAPVFASFNRPAKFNDAVLDAWAGILQRVPEASLELGANLFGDEIARARTLQRFAQRGIAAERLRLHGQRGYAQLLEAYRRVDIALDPFPFSGCTTTCDALWMGVPVIARSGETFVARQSASLLARLGRDEWIASDDADYVQRAVAMAQRVHELRAARADLREWTRLRLCAAQTQAIEFAELLRTLWREHCGSR